MRFLALGFFLTTENGFGGVLSVPAAASFETLVLGLGHANLCGPWFADGAFTAIGRAIAYFSGLDVTLDVAISRLLNVKSGAHAAITVGFGTESKVDLLESLADYPGPRPGKKRNPSPGQSHPVSDCDRNFIAHAHCSTGAAQKSTAISVSETKLDIGRDSWDAEKIEGIAREFNRIEGDLLEWYFRKTLKRKHVSWHDRRLPPAQQSRPQDLRALYSATRRLPPRPSGA